MILFLAQITAPWNCSSSKTRVIFLIQALLDAKTHVLEKYIKFSSGLFLNNSYWYNLSWNYDLEAK